MRIFRTRNALGALLCISLAGLFAAPAAANSLSFEAFTAQDPVVPGHVITITCGPTSGTLSYHVEGMAAGPHMGTFVEDGTVLFDPLTGLLLSFDATFSITSVGGNVTGEKHLLPSGLGTARCGPLEFSDQLASDDVCYRAEFAGGGNEVGRSTVFLDFVQPGQGQVGGSFTETFTPDATVSCGRADDDDDDDDDDDSDDSDESDSDDSEGDD